MRRRVLLSGLAPALLAAILTACGGGSDGAPGEAVQQPYAGWEARPLAALSPEEVEDLLAGRGAGYALAAELNHYPGPTHALDLAGDLGLSAEQIDAIEAIKGRMQEEAQALGKQLVDLEAQLDEAFGTGSIAPASLQELTTAIAGVEGTLRSVHLSAHIEVKALLSDEQVRRYDALRGYTGHATEGQHPSSGHQGH